MGCFVYPVFSIFDPEGTSNTSPHAARRGHTRANAGGLDLNRCYGDANPGDHEGRDRCFLFWDCFLCFFGFCWCSFDVFGVVFKVDFVCFFVCFGLM